MNGSGGRVTIAPFPATVAREAALSPARPPCRCRTGARASPDGSARRRPAKPVGALATGRKLKRQEAEDHSSASYWQRWRSRADGAGPAIPADQPTISAQTVSKETEQSFITLVTGFRLVFFGLCVLATRVLERVIIGIPSMKMTLAKRSASARKRTPIISQPAGIEPPSTPKGVPTI